MELWGLQCLGGETGICPPSIGQPFMEMADKQFFPFMETVVQPCLTACVTASYDLCNCVLQFIEMVGKQFFPFMETVMQPCLTACVTASYSLCNCVLRFMEMAGKQFSPFMETVLEVVRAKISELHKKLGNSENRVTYRLR